MTTLTVAQAAIELDLSPAAVRAAIRRGALPARKVLGRHRLAAADVRRAADGVPAQSKELRHADHDQSSAA
jgi:hypothetical protein